MNLAEELDGKRIGILGGRLLIPEESAEIVAALRHASEREIAFKTADLLRKEPNVVLKSAAAQEAKAGRASAITTDAPAAAAPSEKTQTINSERTAGTAKAAEPLAGRTVLHDPAPEREGEIAGRESLDPEGPGTARLIVERAPSGRAERLDGGERPASSLDDKPSDTPRTDEATHDSRSILGGYAIVSAELARQLERELAKARREIQKICQQQADADAAREHSSAIGRTDQRVIQVRQRIEGWRGEVHLGDILKDIEEIVLRPTDRGDDQP